VTEGWDSEEPPPPPAALACTLARDRFWQDPVRRLIGTHPRWPDAAYQLALEEELAHALVLVLSRLPESRRRDFADVFYAERRGSGRELPRDDRLRLALAAAVVLQVADLVGRADIYTDRVRDLLNGLAQGDDVTVAPAPALDEVRKGVARIRFDVDFEDPTDPRAAAALAVAEVLDPSSDAVALQEVLARSAWAAVGSWEPPRVLGFLLEAERLFAEAYE